MFEAAFMRVALLASIAVSIPLSVIGVYLTIRRVVFLGLVLANAATIGTRGRATVWVADRDPRGHRRLDDRTWSGRSSPNTPRVWRIDYRMGVHDGRIGYRARPRRPARPRPMRIRSACCPGNVLAVSPGHATGLVALALVGRHRAGPLCAPDFSWSRSTRRLRRSQA